MSKQYLRTSRDSRRLFVSFAVAACTSGIVGCHGHDQAASGPVSNVVPTAPSAQVTPSTAALPPTPIPPDGIKGVYLTGWTAGNKKRLEALAEMADRTEINSMVIDVKDDGEISYGVDVPLATEVHAIPNDGKGMYKISRVMRTLAEHNIFPIARIACMRDSFLPKIHPEMAVQDAKGHVWHDKSHHTWLNPYNKTVWDYNVDIALDALKHGFRGIQFDYVRFPSEGDLSKLHYPGKPANSLREDQINAFMEYAHDKVKAAGGIFSADVFGLTSLVKNDEGIGQKFKKLILNVDYLSPMVYPSHYNYHEYGLPDPNTQPYKIVTLSVGDAQKRLADVTTCKLCPWIQDFSLRGVHYGPTEVRAEIKALNDLGIHDFLLWNAGCKFTEAALSPASKEKIAAREAAARNVAALAPLPAATQTKAALSEKSGASAKL